MTESYKTLNGAIDLIEKNYREERRKLYLADGTPKYSPEAMEAEENRLREEHASVMSGVAVDARERVRALEAEVEELESRPLSSHLNLYQRERLADEVDIARSELASVNITDPAGLARATGHVLKHGNAATALAYRMALEERGRQWVEKRQEQAPERPVPPLLALQEALTALVGAVRGTGHTERLEALEEELRRTAEVQQRASYLRGAPGTKSLVQAYYEKRGGFHMPETTDVPTGDALRGVVRQMY